MPKSASRNTASTHAKNPAHGRHRVGRGSTFLGILIGLVLGLSIALGVAWYINKLPNPFREKPQGPAAPVPAPSKAESTTPPVAAKTESTKEGSEAPKAVEVDKAKAAESQAKDATADKGDKSTPAAKDAFFLQAGSFQNAPDADTLKARLALLGMEATIQTRTLPEKGVFHRVRIGPYTDVEELKRVRGVLTQNGIDAALVKVREADK